MEIYRTIIPFLAGLFVLGCAVVLISYLVYKLRNKPKKFYSLF